MRPASASATRSPAALCRPGRWCGRSPARAGDRLADVEALARLAQHYRIEPVWYDIFGGRHEVTHTALRALLAAMHVPAATDEEVQASLAARHARTWSEAVPPVLVVRVSQLPLRVTLRLPAAADAQTLRWRLDQEGGATHTGTFEPRTLEETERAQLDGRMHVARRMALDLQPAPGYHRFTLSAGERTLGRALVAVAPDACFLPAAVQGEGRVFRPTAQLYTLRSSRNWGIGDFTDLRTMLKQ